jgi:hypothetical protein
VFDELLVRLIADVLTVINIGPSPSAEFPVLLVADSVCRVLSVVMVRESSEAIVTHYGCDNLYVDEWRLISQVKPTCGLKGLRLLLGATIGFRNEV